MKRFLLARIRLSAYYPLLFILFFIVLSVVDKVQLTGGQLTLFSVNSFLLAFYLGPILGSQKQRIDDLTKTIRAEALAFFKIAVFTQDLGVKNRHAIKTMARKYLLASVHAQKPVEGEAEYEALLRYCIDYDGKDKEGIKKIQEVLINNEENRSQLSVQLRAGVFSHEWFVLLVLLSITLSYVVIIDYGSNWLLTIVGALLCTGLCLLLIILAKLSTLHHKKAKPIWRPFERLLDTDFKHIDSEK